MKPAAVTLDDSGRWVVVRVCVSGVDRLKSPDAVRDVLALRVEEACREMRESVERETRVKLSMSDGKVPGLNAWLNRAYVHATLTGTPLPPDPPPPQPEPWRGPSLLSPEDVDALDAHMAEAERSLSRALAEHIFAPFAGPAVGLYRTPLRTRLRWRWYAAREWIAVHVLRVDVHQCECEQED